jgi:hypothetical protein
MIKEKALLVGPDGKPVKSEDLNLCPKCGGGQDKRGPSSSFGAAWTVCSCGHEFKEIPWRNATW